MPPWLLGYLVQRRAPLAWLVSLSRDMTTETPASVEPNFRRQEETNTTSGCVVLQQRVAANELQAPVDAAVYLTSSLVRTTS